PGRRLGGLLGQPRGRRPLGPRRPAARGPVLPLDPPLGVAARTRQATARVDSTEQPTWRRDRRVASMAPMLHHVLLEDGDLERSASFYVSMLAPLGWRRRDEENRTIGCGIAKPVFFIAAHHEPR